MTNRITIDRAGTPAATRLPSKGRHGAEPIQGFAPGIAQRQRAGRPAPAGYGHARRSGYAASPLRLFRCR